MISSVGLLIQKSKLAFEKVIVGKKCLQLLGWATLLYIIDNTNVFVSQKGSTKRKRLRNTALLYMLIVGIYIHSEADLVNRQLNSYLEDHHPSSRKQNSS
jgi:hypothetical protein